VRPRCRLEDNTKVVMKIIDVRTPVRFVGVYVKVVIDIRVPQKMAYLFTR
jgi:hypothetical protein